MALYLARALALGLLIEWPLVWLLDKPMAGFLVGIACIFAALAMQYEVAEDEGRLVRMD